MPGDKDSSSFGDPVLLSKIDDLFSCGVGEYVDLPQLVVVGDQSSGKSSILEGLVGLAFPRDSGLCTRFATQIAFRRAKNSSVSVFIRPGRNVSAEHATKLKEWKKTGMKKHDLEANFAEIMAEAHELMGLGNQNVAGSKGTFSEDVLQLEIKGPKEEHFSVVDVPGIFRKTTSGVTTKADREMVKLIVRDYMSNARSVMLTVVPANVDPATQEILTLAEEVDSEGHRTLGVLTKPDLVDRGAEGPVMDLMNGHKHQLFYGWHIVRNPGQAQLNDPNIDRNAIEKAFFQITYPWDTLERQRVGIHSLKLRLQEILSTHIRSEFPKVKAEINKRLTTSRQALQKLGAKRETSVEQYQYLMDISVQFTQITTQALNASYAGSDWFDEHESLRFVTELVNRSEAFAEQLETYGHEYEFQVVEKLPKSADPQATGMQPTDNATFVEDDRSKKRRTEALESVRSTVKHIDLQELDLEEGSITKDVNKETMHWLSKAHKASRGFELGTFDASLIATTMKTQSAKWDKIAFGYISDIITMAHQFITDLLRLVCGDSRVREGIMSCLMDELLVRYAKAKDQVEFLLELERSGIPTTQNHYFSDNLEKSRDYRMRASVRNKVIIVETSGLGEVVRLDDIASNHTMSNAERTVQDVHDILHSYYRVARKRFVDNICKQAAEFFLVTSRNAPIKLFGPKFVSSLSTEQIAMIAGEDAGTKRRRRTLEKEIKDLEAGKKILT